MRVSLFRDDPGYTGPMPGTRVYLDGTEVRDVQVADDSIGLVVRCKRDERGKLMLNEARDDVWREELRGQVRIEVPARYARCVRA